MSGYPLRLRIRNWLLVKLAGNCTIVINATADLNVCDPPAGNMHGMLLHNCRSTNWREQGRESVAQQIYNLL